MTFRIPIAIQFVPGGLLALGTFVLQESPVLLMRRGKTKQAVKNLCYLRQLPADHQYVLEEMGMIEARLAEENKLSSGRGGWLALLRGAGAELKLPSVRYRLYVLMVTSPRFELTRAQCSDSWHVFIPELVRLHLHQVGDAPR